MSTISQRKIPVQPAERIDFIDILRGFAVFGILVANMASYSGQVYDLSNQGDLLDYSVLVLIRFFITAKFYSLFSFLFGWGMSVQMNRSLERGLKFTQLYQKRLAFLLFIGIAHGIFIWTGDILTLYAVLGFLLLFIRNRSEKFLGIILVLSLLFTVLIRAPVETITSFRAWYEDITSFMRYDIYSETLYSTGTYQQITQIRIQEFIKGNSWIVFYFGNVFAMFVFGLIIGKRKLFQEIENHLTFIRKVFWIVLVVGVLFNGLFVWMDINPNWRVANWIPQSYNEMIQRTFYSIGAPALMLFYCTGVILLLQKDKWRPHLIPLGNVGKMALTNYLLQSITFTLIFYNYGLGIYGEISPTFGLILTFGFFILQIRISRRWFEHFRFGPMEWLWRTLTYGKVQHLTHRGSGNPIGSPNLPRKYIQNPIIRNRTIRLLALFTFVLIFSIGLLINWRSISEINKEDSKIAQTSNFTSLSSLLDLANNEITSDTTSNSSNPKSIFNIVPTNIKQATISNDIQPIYDSFDVNQALRQIEILTSHPFLGRQSGSPEGYAAGDYIAQQYEKYGLLPFGDHGTYFQNFTVNYTPLKTIPTFQVEKPDGTSIGSYEIYDDYSPIIRWYAGEGSSHRSVYWANDCTKDDFAEIDIVGIVVLCQPGDHADWMVGILRNAVEHGASGLLIIGDPLERPPDFASPTKEFWLPETVPAFWVYPDIIHDLLSGSGKTMEDLLSSSEVFPLETKVDINVSINMTERCPGSNCQARNILGILPGRDPAVAHEIIVLGAHYDHMGQGPDGTVWSGANDNASGVSILLELARCWQEQGFKPRRSVLFAAWDAEELGLLGSRHYINSPLYPLENTLAMIQLDMVGAGEEILLIDGHSELSEHIQRVAQWLEIPTNISQIGRSDHTPFLEAGIPASLLIWSSNEDSHYHQPKDTIEAIDPEKLNIVAKVFQVTILDIVESAPAITDLLAHRAKAAETGDLSTFLSTSTNDQDQFDRVWLNDLMSLPPINVEIETNDLIIVGTQAKASLNIQVDYLDSESEPITKTLHAQFPSTFSLGSDGWKFDGPNLQWHKADNLPDGSTLTIGLPPDSDIPGEIIAEHVKDIYIDYAGTLNLPTEFDVKLFLMPDEKSLQSSTALTLLKNQDYWVGPGIMKLVYTENITSSQQLTDSIAKLVLADSGINEDVTPWLWHGLPTILQARSQPIAVQQRNIPRLQESLITGAKMNTLASSWAATDYLNKQLGWIGLGQFISQLGQICQDNGCNGPSGLDRVLLDNVNLDYHGFEQAWQNEWISRLDSANNTINQVLSKRGAAIDNLEENLFLSTVDQNIPNLLGEERNWFRELKNAPPTVYVQEGSPLAFLPDGSILANILVSYSWENSVDNAERTHSLKILFSKSESDYKWSGPLFEQLTIDAVEIRYPIGEDDLARQLLTLSKDIYPELARHLGVVPPDKVSLTLYETRDAFSNSISLSYPNTDSGVAWTNKGNNIKLKLLPDSTSEDYIPLLATQLSRNLLYQQKIKEEWLINGVSLHLSRPYASDQTYKLLGSNIPILVESYQTGTLLPLNEIPPTHSIPETRLNFVNAQSWDAVEFLITTYGWSKLQEVINYQSQGMNLKNAFQRTTGTTIDAFEDNWKNSLHANHLTKEHVQIALEFDHDMAMQHVNSLTTAELAGRKAGSPGDRQASAYISEKFDDYGLVPIGNQSWRSIQNSLDDQGTMLFKSMITDTIPTFYQSFPISTTLQTGLPQFDLVNTKTNSEINLKYRQDFIIIQASSKYEDSSLQHIIWIGGEGYQDANLQGGYALRQSVVDMQKEISEAVNHGAGGLIIVGSRNKVDEIYQKSLSGNELTRKDPIPVYELTLDGFNHLLELIGHDRQSMNDLVGFHPLDIQLRTSENITSKRSANTTNIIGLLPGSDPFLKRETIIIGAHYDHVGDDPDGTRYSGANDDASGIAVLLEIARLWQETGYKPKRSVLFAAWGAQELGNLGSEYYVTHPVLPLESTTAMIQLDGVGGGDGFNLGAQGEWESVGIILNNLEVAEIALDEKIVFTDPHSYSDHYSFESKGIPSVMLSWRLANEENLPDSLTNTVHPERLSVSGKVTSVLLMGLSR